MNSIISINGITNSNENFVTWSPAPGQIQLVNPGAATNPVKVRLRNRTPGQGRQLSFSLTRTGNAADELELDLPTNGSPVNFFVAGKFDENNMADYDASMQVVAVNGGNVLSVTPVFVRVRRNAEKLLPAERDLFLSALDRLNNSGNGIFEQFRTMHVENSLDEAHGFAGFLPWHRAYLLDLERELQNIEPRIALPYWRFDEPAPKLFSKEFIGESDQNGTVVFTSGHSLETWTTEGVQGINRKALFNTKQESARGISGGISFVVINEKATLRIKFPNHRLYESFITMEGQPHGAAHVSFDEDSSISDPRVAPKDPLFFLLHTNVDRLWALWQFTYKRFDASSPSTYSTNGGELRIPGNIGHNLNDTMWPWNEEHTFPRPQTSPVPGGSFPASLIVKAPGLTPRVVDTIDYQGIINALRCLGFDYDDVPFSL